MNKITYEKRSTITTFANQYRAVMMERSGVLSTAADATADDDAGATTATPLNE